MTVRLWGGPKHNKLWAVGNNNDIILQQPGKMNWNPFDNNYSIVSELGKMGRYVHTYVKDNQGHNIMAWTGWW